MRGPIFDEIVQILSDHSSEGYYKIYQRDTEVSIEHLGQTHKSFTMMPLWYIQVVVSPEMMMMIKMLSAHADKLKSTEFKWED